MLERCGMDRLAATDARAADWSRVTTTCGEKLRATVKASVRTWCSRRASHSRTFFVLLTEWPGCSERCWPDHAFLQAQASRCEMELAVYACGMPPGDWAAFHLPAARKVTPSGLHRSGMH